MVETNEPENISVKLTPEIAAEEIHLLPELFGDDFDDNFIENRFPGLLKSQAFKSFVEGYDQSEKELGDFFIAFHQLVIVLVGVKQKIYDISKYDEWKANYEKSEENKKKIKQFSRATEILEGLPEGFYMDLRRKNRKFKDVAGRKVAVYDNPRREGETEAEWMSRINNWLDPKFFFGNFGTHIGRRGRAATEDKVAANRQAITRLIAECLPANITNRYATTVELMRFAGIDTDRHSVKSALNQKRIP